MKKQFVEDLQLHKQYKNEYNINQLGTIAILNQKDTTQCKNTVAYQTLGKNHYNVNRISSSKFKK